APETHPTMPAPAAPAAPVVTPGAGAMPTAGSLGPARKLVIVSGAAAGTELALDDQIVTIGRSPDSTLVIMDEYTSTYHARLNRGPDGWTLTDLDSTNGTRLAGARVRDSVPLPTHTPVTIGKTSFELRP
ncbi:FHA domain-containing protein, partial [Leucobacter sp. M11]|uniref:FHA domain-containing protein n=1 Tax=Leucobacter sp. M11 TaxID=2993565 RepID=UPI002D807CEF